MRSLTEIKEINEDELDEILKEFDKSISEQKIEARYLLEDQARKKKIQCDNCKWLNSCLMKTNTSCLLNLLANTNYSSDILFNIEELKYTLEVKKYFGELNGFTIDYLSIDDIVNKRKIPLLCEGEEICNEVYQILGKYCTKEN